MDNRMGMFTLEQAKQKTNELLRREIAVAPPKIVRERTAYLADSQGKQLRAQSLLLCAQKDGMVAADAVYAAAAIELIHLASLLHDDVIDDSPVRRNAETLQKKHGKHTAVLCGDYFLCRSMKLLSNIEDEAVKGELLFVDCMNRLCMGELWQTINLFNFQLQIPQYLRIVAGKTAALFEAAFYAGALFAKADKRTAKQYARLGRMMGIIFQISDDCIDYETDESIAQKAVQLDFQEGVVTLPLIYAIQADPQLAAQLKEPALMQTADVCRAVCKNGGVEKALKLSERYYEKAHTLLGRMDVPEEQKQALHAIIHRAYQGLRV